jgi:hypothetical protein
MRAAATALLVTAPACSCGVAVVDESTSSAVTRGANTVQTGEPRTRHLGIRSPLHELLCHPAFAGYARRLLPRDDAAIGETLPIGRIDSLLPYHSDVVPEVVVDALNHLSKPGNIAKPN